MWERKGSCEWEGAALCVWELESSSFPWTFPGEDGGVCFVVIKSEGDQLSAGHRGWIAKWSHWSCFAVRHRFNYLSSSNLDKLMWISRYCAGSAYQLGWRIQHRQADIYTETFMHLCVHIYINIYPTYTHWHNSPCSDTQSHQHTHTQILNKPIITVHIWMCLYAVMLTHVHLYQS